MTAAKYFDEVAKQWRRVPQGISRSTADSLYVNVDGDTMVGSLRIEGASLTVDDGLVDGDLDVRMIYRAGLDDDPESENAVAGTLTDLLMLGAYGPGSEVHVRLGSGYTTIPGASVDVSAHDPVSGVEFSVEQEVGFGDLLGSAMKVTQGAFDEYPQIELFAYDGAGGATALSGSTGSVSALEGWSTPTRGDWQRAVGTSGEGLTMVSSLSAVTASEIHHNLWVGGSINEASGAVLHLGTTGHIEVAADSISLVRYDSSLTGEPEPVRLGGVDDPEEETDAANKQYADGLIAAHEAHPNPHPQYATDDDLAAAAAGSGHSIQDEETPVVDRPNLAFVGDGVAVTDDAANDRTVVTITGSTAPTRAAVSITTASLAAGASESGTIALAPGYRLYRITTSHPCRVRLYTTAAKRDADAGRPIGTDPSGDHGLVLEWVSTSGLLAADLSPMVDGFDGKATPDGDIPALVTNLWTGAVGIQVDLTYLRTE